MERPVQSAESPDARVSGSLENSLDFRDSRMLGVIVSVLAVILTLLLIKLWFSQRSARRGVLVLGLSDAGKTLLWSCLIHGKNVKTYTSAKENVGEYQTNKGILKVIDIPGHERLRSKFIDQYKSSARAAIFVVDALTFQKEIRDVAEYLFNILSDSAISRNCKAVIVLAHKQDQAMAKGSSLVQSSLEKELNVLRETKAKQLDSISDKKDSKFYLGKPGKDFTFSQLSSIQFNFAETSVLTDDPSGLEPLKMWLASIA